MPVTAQLLVSIGVLKACYKETLFKSAREAIFCFIFMQYKSCLFKLPKLVVDENADFVPF